MNTKPFTIRCTKRIRDPLNYLILQPTDLDTVVNSIYTRHAGVFTFYMPLLNIQSILHKRYEAEQVAELVLPPGTAPPQVRSLTMTEENIWRGMLEEQQQQLQNKKGKDEAVEKDKEAEKKEATNYQKLFRRMGGYLGTKGKMLEKLKDLDTSKFVMSAPSKEQVFRNENNNQVTNEEERILSKGESVFHNDNSGSHSTTAGSDAEKDNATANKTFLNLPDAKYYQVNEKGETVVPLGLVTLVVGENYPLDKAAATSSSADTAPTTADLQAESKSFFDYAKHFTLAQKFLYKYVDPLPYTTLSIRCLVMDRIHWQRTSWLAGSICKSACFGEIPQKIFSIELDYKNPVFINGGDANNDATTTTNSTTNNNNANKVPIEFDFEENKYKSLYQVEVPAYGFKLAVEDTGVSLFDSHLDLRPDEAESQASTNNTKKKKQEEFELHNKIVDGFLENESALHRLGLCREVNMLGLGGSVYRQTLWCSPSLPNIAKLATTNTNDNNGSNSKEQQAVPKLQLQYGSLFKRYFGCDPVGDPVALWVVNEIPKTLLYQMEGEVEDENDPNSATTYGDRSLTERVQKKAMNRYNSFRDDLRHKTYSDISGEELPR